MPLTQCQKVFHFCIQEFLQRVATISATRGEIAALIQAVTAIGSPWRAASKEALLAAFARMAAVSTATRKHNMCRTINMEHYLTINCGKYGEDITRSDVAELARHMRLLSICKASIRAAPSVGVTCNVAFNVAAVARKHPRRVLEQSLVGFSGAA